MNVAWIDRLSLEYPQLIETLVSDGDVVESRVGRVKEIAPFVMTLDEPAHCVVKRSGFSRRFLDLEVAMLLAGEYDHDLTESVSPVAAGLLAPHTAYGPRVKYQLRDVAEELRESPVSRRAVVYVGRDTDYRDAVRFPKRSKGEMPCTCLWQFLVRGGKLGMVTYMRSWDAVWGLSYDVPCFVAVQQAMAKALGVAVGSYGHVAGSLHIYERHWTLATTPNEDGELTVDYITDDITETQREAKTRMDAMRGAG